MLLAQDPRLLLVDEPAAGMTAGLSGSTRPRSCRGPKTRAVIVVEHATWNSVRRLDCKVTVLHEGSVLARAALTT
jgi:urea transport system ATP-binding protein